MIDVSQIASEFKAIQDSICRGIEFLEGTTKFKEDQWVRNEGGGGRTRVIQGHNIDKGGVNFSCISGSMPENIAKALKLAPNEFTATGVSIVLHPSNPWVPIIHMNIRYFETSEGSWWFGGGIDLTPHYIDVHQAQRFHYRLKSLCDQLNDVAYDEFKLWADNYFFNKHRAESRGIGGIFFDRLNQNSYNSKFEIWNFVKSLGINFVPIYAELFSENNEKEYNERHKDWQMIRRGRYVEFNLVYDKGTKFGLDTGGRIESILMSLPLYASWPYNFQPESNSIEQRTLNFLGQKIDWINYKEE